VSDYVNNSTKPDTVINFKFSEEDYTSFKSFVEKRNFSYSTKSESMFDELMELAKEEEYYEASRLEFQKLKNSLRPSLNQDLDRFKNQISTELESMIARRYFFRSGEIQYNLQKDPLISKSLEVFSSNYNSILGN